MNDPYYNNMYRQAINLERNFNDATAGSNHPEKNVLHNEMRHLIEDLETKKNPRTIEGRVKVIQQQIQQAQNQSHPMMNYGHYDHFHDAYEQMKLGLRKFDNY